jgi:hypothetical protein
VLKVIQDVIASTRIQMTLEEAYILWPKVKDFATINKREPDVHSTDSKEVRLAEALIYIKEQN